MLDIEVVTMIATKLFMMQIGDITLHSTLWRSNIYPVESNAPDNQQQYHQQLTHSEYKDRLKIEN